MSLSRTTKKRLLIVLCCGLLLGTAGVGAYVVRKQRVRAEYAGYRAQGLAAAKGADNEKAVDLLGKYLRRYPEDADVLVEYARVRPLVKSPDRAHLRDTMLVLRHLLTLRPEMAEQRRALLRMYGDFGYATEAVVTADKLLETTPDDPEILGIKATSLARMRRSAEALAAAQKWAEKAPQDVDAHILCVQMMQASGRPKGDVENLVKGLEAKLKDEASLQLVGGITAAVTGSPADAFKLIQQAAAHPNLDPKLTRRVIAAFDSLGKHQESLDMLRKLVKATGDATAQRALVRRLWELNQWNDVLAYPIPAGSELASDLELKGMIGTALARSGKTAEAQAIATELTAARQDPVAVAWGEVLGQSVTPGKADARKLVDVCQAGLKDAPGNAYLSYFLAQGYGRLGEAELAVASYTRAAQQNGTWAAPLGSLAEALMGLGRHEQALDAATAAFQRSQAGGALVLAMALNASIEAGRRGDEAGLQQLLTGIEANAGAAPYVLPERVASLARTGKKTEAAEAIKKALAATPAPGDAIVSRLAMMSRLHGLGLEAQCYEALERRGGASASLAMSKALATYLSGNKDEALAQFEKARRESGKGDSAEWQIASARLLDLARDPKAAAAWVALGDARPDDLGVQEAALAAATARSDREFVDRTIERVKKLTGGEGVQWRVARARWTLDGAAGRSQAEVRKAGEEASLVLTEVLRAAPDAIDARFLQVKALEYQENFNAAIEQMTAVVQQNPSLPASSLYLAKLLQARGDFAKAHDYVARATQAGLKDESSRRIAAQLLAQQGKPGEATKLLEDVAGGGGEGAADLLLATLYRQQGDLKRAEQICAQLLQKPDEAVIAFAVDLYGAMGRPDDAKKAIALLKGLKAKPGTEELLLAEFSGRYGKPEDAVAYCLKATQVAPKNPSAWRALVLSSLATGKANEATAAVEQGLKELPGDAYLKAMTEVRPVVEGALADPSLRPLALALARSPEMPGTKDALQLMSKPIGTDNSKAGQLGRLKQIADQNPLNLPLQLFTAERLLSAGDRLDDATMLTTRAVQSFPVSPDASRLAARALLGGKRWPEAVGFARAWRERTPANPGEADVMAAVALMKSNQPAEAKAVLEPYIAKALEQPEPNAGLITLYAAALHNSGAAQEAERILMPALKSSEAVRSAWLARAAEDLAVPDAVNWLGRVSAITGGDNSVASQVQMAAASTALGQKAGNDQLLATARALRAKVAARTDLNVQALAVLASQAEQDHDLAMAEGLYRRALKLDGSLAVIKNNLAMVLVNQGRKENLAEATILAADAVRTNPGVANFYDTLAQVQAKAGETDKAADTLRKAAAIDPDHLDWQVNLVQVLIGGGRTNEATKALADLDKTVANKRTISDDLKAKIAAVRRKVGDSRSSAVSAGPG